jgi:hypothetical protein
MKKIIQGAMLGLSIISMSAIAQEGTRFGVGVSFSGQGNTVKVPIDLGALRIEPELSFLHDTTGDGTTNYHIGSGVYLQNHVTNVVDLYFGGKALIIHQDYGVADDTIFSVSGVAGFEYFLDKQVSLGGEAEFGIGIGDETTVGIQTGVVLRYYFQ